jgi:hypothetical protein
VTGMRTRERPYGVQGSCMPKDLCQNRRDGVNRTQFASFSSLNLCEASAADSPSERDLPQAILAAEPKRSVETSGLSSVCDNGGVRARFLAARKINDVGESTNASDENNGAMFLLCSSKDMTVRMQIGVSGSRPVLELLETLTRPPYHSGTFLAGTHVQKI